MTPFRMRLFVVAFLALATATSINALYLQEAPRHIAGVKSPSTAKNDTERPVSPTAALPEALAQPDKPVATNPPANAALHETATPQPETLPPPAPLVKSIQRELYQRGYLPGRQDGVLALECRAAIVAYEFDEKMPLTGEASEAVLKSLIFAKASGNPSKAKNASADRFEHRKEVVEPVQQMLAQLGYTSGPVDGRLDAKTRDAIRKFEADRHLKPAGHLTERVLLEMVIVTGRPLPASS